MYRSSAFSEQLPRPAHSLNKNDFYMGCLNMRESNKFGFEVYFNHLDSSLEVISSLQLFVKEIKCK